MKRAQLTKTTIDSDKVKGRLINISPDMAVEASPNFDPYRMKYGCRPPELARLLNQDEVEDKSKEPDVFSLPCAPAGFCSVGSPPTDRGSSGTLMHVWLVTAEDVLTSVEKGASGQATTRGRLSHTNLSGGAEAYAGGELWFSDPANVWLTGGSSRYTPRSADELDEIVSAFRRSGYAVCSCGWDEGIDGPARFFRGEQRWLAPNE